MIKMGFTTKEIMVEVLLKFVKEYENGDVQIPYIDAFYEGRFMKSYGAFDDKGIEPNEQMVINFKRRTK
jgi:hypothetical protein